MKSDFLLAFNQICSDRKLSREVVLEALQMALVSAYRRSVGASASQNITAKINLETGKSHIFVEKSVVDEVTNPEVEISLVEAQQVQPNVSIGDSVMIDSTPDDFGRIAAQSAKQIILQRIREAERDAQYARYVQQEGEIVHGTVHSITPQAVVLHIDGTEAILPRSQQVPGERYSLHQRLRAYVLEVRKTSRGPQITISRSHKNMLRRLLELEVPEIYNGTVEIKAITREAGSRSKVAVAARQAGVDPVGACVGMRGVRIQSIVNELGGEKIDVIEWDPNPATFIAKALSPAKVLTARLEEDSVEGKTANVVVPDDQLSLAIGRAGQNARLAAKLTGWRIDIQSVTEAATEALRLVNEDDNVLPALGSVAELLPSVANFLHQHERERLPFSNEELRSIRLVIEGVQGYYDSIRSAERERARAEEESRRAAIEAAKDERRAAIQAAYALIPSEAYDVPLTEIGLSSRVLKHLQNAQLDTVGDVLERLAEGDEGLLKLDGFGPRSLTEVKTSIDALALPEKTLEQPVERPGGEALAPGEEAVQIPEAAVMAQETPVVELEEVTEPAPATSEGAETETPVTVEAEASVKEPEETPGVVSTLETESETAVEPEISQEVVTAEEPPTESSAPPDAVTEEVVFVEEEEILEILEEKPSRKRGRKRRRELIFDEATGTVVSRRKHRRDKDIEDWEEYL